MKVIDVTNSTELFENLKKNKKNFVLVYKKGSELSDCAYKSLLESDNIEDVKIYAIDVNEVKDFHQNYQITTAPTLLELEYDKLVNTFKGCNPPDYYKNVILGNVFIAQSQTNSNLKPQKRVIVYSTPSCPWCNKLKQYLNENNIRYTDIDVSKDLAAAQQMISKSGQQGVPQIEINGQIVVGFDKKKIDQLLEITNN